LIHGCNAAPKPEAPLTILVPKIVDLAAARCPEVTEAERAQSNAWVKRLRPDENNRKEGKAKLDEYQIGQVRDKAMINSLIADKAACRGDSPKVSS
jgi:hypothetical protein